MLKVPTDALRNRAHWDRTSDAYQAQHGQQLYTSGCAWGVWALPEDELRVLGVVADKDILEFGCGGAQWSIALEKLGARPVGLDNSSRQLYHARRLMEAAGVNFPLLHATGEDVPLADEIFDIVFCDHGAMSFADPEVTLAEVARILRPGGVLVFNMASPLLTLCWNEKADRSEATLHADYFEMRRLDDGRLIEYQLPYGEWIRLFRRNGFFVEDLVELRPPAGATTSYDDYAPLDWARRWPAENIWKVRKQ